MPLITATIAFLMKTTLMKSRKSRAADRDRCTHSYTQFYAHLGGDFLSKRVASGTRPIDFGLDTPKGKHRITFRLLNLRANGPDKLDEKTS